MELCLAIMLAAKKAGILAGGDGKDGTHSYTVVDARDPINIIVRPTGRATLSTVQSNQEYNYTLSEDDDQVELFVKLADMLVDENLDTKASKLLKIIKSLSAVVDANLEEDEATEDGEGESESEEDEFAADEDDTEEEYEEEAGLTYRDPKSFLDAFDAELAAPADTVTVVAVDVEDAPVEVAASALIASNISVRELDRLVREGTMSRFQIMSELAAMIGHEEARQIFNALQTIHTFAGVMPAGFSDLADEWCYKLLAYVTDAAGNMVASEVRGALLGYWPSI